jgi:intraflagellar transport protein 74
VPLASQRITDNETRSVELLRQISTALQSGAELPDAESYAQDKSLLNFKQSQLSKSEQTAKSLDGKLARLKKDQANVDALESKIRVEMTNLEEQIETMKTGLVT